MGSRGVLTGSAEEGPENIEWELRPGGMLVQKREPEVALVQGPMIKVKVSHGLFTHDITISAQATFGDLKKMLVHETSLQPSEQRLLFRGKQKEDSEWLHVAGVKDKAKIILVEDPASRERRLEEMRKQEQIAKGCKAVGLVRAEVDNLAAQILTLEKSITSGSKAMKNDFGVLTEMLMRQLLKLDSVQADGEAKTLRRAEVKRIQSLVEAVDALKVRNAMPAPLPNSTVVVTTKWETFDNGVGSLTAPPPSTAATVTTDWERFD